MRHAAYPSIVRAARSDCFDAADNWANAYCIVAIARNLAAEYDRTIGALEDVREMMRQHGPTSAARDFADAVDRTVAAQSGWKCVRELDDRADDAAGFSSLRCCATLSRLMRCASGPCRRR